jgi:hypothetical protein
VGIVIKNTWRKIQDSNFQSYRGYHFNKTPNKERKDNRKEGTSHALLSDHATKSQLRATLVYHTAGAGVAAGVLSVGDIGGLCASCLLLRLFLSFFTFLPTLPPGVVGLAAGVAGLLAAASTASAAAADAAAAATAACRASSLAFVAAASASAFFFLAAAVETAKLRLPGSPCSGFSSVKGSSP